VGKVNIDGATEPTTKVPSKMTIDMGMDRCIGLTTKYRKVNGLMASKIKREFNSNLNIEKNQI
jgi:hypothetical protein